MISNATAHNPLLLVSTLVQPNEAIRSYLGNIETCGELAWNFVALGGEDGATSKKYIIFVLDLCRSTTTGIHVSHYSDIIGSEVGLSVCNVAYHDFVPGVHLVSDLPPVPV